jgi:hypothetical protein
MFFSVCSIPFQANAEEQLKTMTSERFGGDVVEASCLR